MLCLLLLSLPYGSASAFPSSSFELWAVSCATIPDTPCAGRTPRMKMHTSGVGWEQRSGKLSHRWESIIRLSPGHILQHAPRKFMPHRSSRLQLTDSSSSVILLFFLSLPPFYLWSCANFCLFAPNFQTYTAMNVVANFLSYFRSGGTRIKGETVQKQLSPSWCESLPAATLPAPVCRHELSCTYHKHSSLPFHYK